MKDLPSTTIESMGRAQDGVHAPESSEPPRGRGRERGAAMVEFALVFLLLFTVITLIVQGGFFFSAWLAVTNGAREGARFAAPCLNRSVQPCTAADVVALVNDRTRGFLDQTAGYSVNVDTSSPHFITVTVRATTASVGPLPLDLPVYGISRMRLEMSPP
jgi:Flp pilus assembly protein TadG